MDLKFKSPDPISVEVTGIKFVDWVLVWKDEFTVPDWLRALNQGRLEPFQDNREGKV
jgi:hypothetical protein